MKKFVCIFVWYFMLFTVLPSCSTDEPNTQKLTASFSFQPAEVQIGTPVNFTSNSTGIDENTVYEWDFGDGKTSSSKTPSHVYTEIGGGTYEVTLTLQNGNNTSAVSQDVKVYYSYDISGRKALIDKLSDDEILICAHRGNHNVHPENSIASVNAAITNSIGMIEIDVRTSKDGELVLMHDKTIDRTTNGSGNVSDFTLQELKDFKLYDGNGVLTTERIPTLKEVLAISRGQLYIDLDIHNKAPFEKVYADIKQYGMVKQVLFYSKDVAVINSIISKDANALAMPNISSASDFNTYTDKGVKVVHYTDASFNQNLVDKAKGEGWYILKNAYVNTSTAPEDDNYNQINKVVNLKGNIIQTDYPVLVKQYIN
ncbi:glycerophosphodiester phosphodiesterase family protein [Hyunsoonleella ulvae]|uniref:glycerophosphodiester phosphodiesterase family protein n=1 Tax=Hyunsoonleella ulvae TaxID=2799948 RepID=UPI00193AD90E|nr:glycerophosphodiester phosphodiesterase family protein [Hyunsoonleella ulvae]